MRFSLAAILFVASTALAAPTGTGHKQPSLITDVGKTVLKLEDGLGVTALEDELDKLFCGELSKLEDKLGVTFAEKLLGLSKSGAGPGDIQAVGEAVAMLLQGVGLPEIDSHLDHATHGAISSLEKELGVTELEKAFGLEKGF